MLPARVAFCGVVLVLCVAPMAAAAQLLHRATDPVATPASSLVLQDDALALDVNPAALAQLDQASVAFLHSEVDQRGSWLARGDALYAALPLFRVLSLGVTLQSIRPEALAAAPLLDGDADRAMAALALALAPNPAFSVGLTARAFTSGNARFDGLTAFDAGLQMRPSSWLRVGVVGRDLFVSREGFGTAGLDLGSSVLFDLGLRPLGDESVTLDFGLFVDTSDAERLAGRGGLTLALPYVGSASGVVEVEELGDGDAALRVIAELAVQFAGVSAVAGGTGGDGFGGDLGGYGMLRIDSQPRRGVPQAVRVLDLEVGRLDTRGMIALALVLERARLDRRVGGVLLRMRGGSVGLAYAQELRQMVAALQRAGKPVVCHLESASGSTFYGCAGANEVLIDPAGDVRLLGLSSEVMLFGGTLREIGVHADFVRIGEHKSAPEQYTQDHMSEAARAQTVRLLDAAHHRMLGDLSANLGWTPARVADVIDHGPYLAPRAVELGLAQGLADAADLEGGELAALGEHALSRKLPSDPSRVWGRRAGIGILVIDDSIVDGDSVDIPLLGVHMTGGRTIVRELDAMARDPQIRAIVLRIDSPGGAVLASDQIWRAVRRARKKKPVIASMGAIATSGGYYVACAADEIWADPSTLTGSIGIFYGKVDVAELARKLGITIEHFRRGRRAGGESLFRPFTNDERAALTEALRGYYQRFLERVAEGRGMRVAQVDALGRGQVFPGEQARENGLIDRLGGLAAVLARARHLAELPADAGVVVRPEVPGGLLDFILGGGLRTEDDTSQLLAQRQPAVPLPDAVRPLLRALALMAQMGSGEPLALLPFVVDY